MRSEQERFYDDLAEIISRLQVLAVPDEDQDKLVNDATDTLLDAQDLAGQRR